MKLTKVAAVVAGSVAALGATAPAFAAEAPNVSPSMSLTSGVTDTLNAVNPVSQALPQTLGNGLAEQGEAVNKVVGTVQDINKVRNNVPGEVMKLANGATQGSPMLGGVKLNGGSN